MTFEELQKARNVISNSKQLIENGKFEGKLCMAIAEVLQWHEMNLKEADTRIKEFLSKVGKTDGQSKDPGTTEAKPAA